jgi:transcriptional regulator with XRE-family HTH domain
MLAGNSSTRNAAHDYGARLRKVLRALRMRQRTFAAHLGFSPGYINDVLQGRTRPSLALIRALRTIYSVSPNYLILGEGTLFLREEGTPVAGGGPPETGARDQLEPGAGRSAFGQLTWLGHPWVADILSRVPTRYVDYLRGHPGQRQHVDPCAAMFLEELVARHPAVEPEEGVRLALQLRATFTRLFGVALRLSRLGQREKLAWLFKTLDAF